MLLRQSTAVDVLIGPFVDSTNGYDSETGLSPAVKLSKAGQALGAKSDATTPVHDADGYYNCELDATDTNTIGTLVLSVVGSATSLAVRHEFQIVEEAVYDALYAASAAGPLQSTTAGRTLDVTATGEAGIDLDNTSGTLDEAQLGADCITAAKIADNAFVAANFAASSLDDKGNWEVAGVAPTVAEIADAVWDETVTGHTGGGKAGDQLWNQMAAIFIDTGEIKASVGTNGDGLTDLGGMSTAMKAEVNAETADVLKTDTIADRTNGAPPTTPTFEEAVMYLYSALVHKIDVDSGFKEYYNNGGTLIWKKALSDDSSNYIEAESQAGS